MRLKQKNHSPPKIQIRTLNAPSGRTIADFLLLRRSGTSFFSAVIAFALAPRSYHCSPPLPVPPSNSCNCSLSYVTVHFLLVVPPLSRTHAQRFPVLTYEPANHRGNLQQPSLFVIDDDDGSNDQ
ncbi:hypothetical protein PIB30_103694 [Stylosanthes scabra]|uniref:Uncharacterized protein n=1 Tax=Stylosanthes scabra TaxID=79078 RepID=A0ABU6QXI4_9FABA|nr:hypothetical protein [Stylosanthes scabra]